MAWFEIGYVASLSSMPVEGRIRPSVTVATSIPYLRCGDRSRTGERMFRGDDRVASAKL